MLRAFPSLVLLAALLAAPSVHAVEQVGQQYQVLPGDMPAPYATLSGANTPRAVRRGADQIPLVPNGFHANAFATELGYARWLAVAPNGDVFLAVPTEGKIVLLRDEKGEGKASRVEVFARGFASPHGMAFHDGYLYIADTRRVWRIPYRDGDLTAQAAAEPVTNEGVFGSDAGHWTRNIAFAPDGRHFYVSVGSASNIGEDPPPRATIQEFDAAGKNQRTFASGLRNAVGIAFYPGSDALFAVINERDGLGDELVPDYLTRIRAGAFYGWPYAYIGNHPQPGFAERRPDLVAKSVVPDLLFRSHSAPLGLAFYSGSQFPERFRGGAFVSLHGSWNANQPRGYSVVYVPFKDGRPSGGYENFATGFWVAGEANAAVWGRPVGLALAKDGSLLIADDVSGSIWRVSYRP